MRNDVSIFWAALAGALVSIWLCGCGDQVRTEYGSLLIDYTSQLRVELVDRCQAAAAEIMGQDPSDCGYGGVTVNVTSDPLERNVLGHYYPHKKSITLVWVPGTCFAAGACVHEHIHYLLDRGGDSDGDHQALVWSLVNNVQMHMAKRDGCEMTSRLPEAWSAETK